MRKILIYIVFIVLLFSAGIYFGLNYTKKNQENNSVPTETTNVKQDDQKTATPNPASVYCRDNGGTLEIISKKDGSQFGLCNLSDYSCEEWTYYRGECTVDSDAQAIKQDLIDMGRDLTGMKVVIKKHLGRDIMGSVVPINPPVAGGGYVFAVKDNGKVSVLADGNGIIKCSSFKDYPDYSTYLLPTCLDDAGNIVQR